MLPLLNPFGPLRLHVERRDTELVLALSGELDLAGERSLEACDRLDLDGVNRITVDLADLRLVDSAGVRSFRQFCERQKAAGRPVALVHSQSSVRRVFAVLGQDAYLNAEPVPA